MSFLLMVDYGLACLAYDLHVQNRPRCGDYRSGREYSLALNNFFATRHRLEQEKIDAARALSEYRKAVMN
jgi:hypothetical protein